MEANSAATWFLSNIPIGVPRSTKDEVHVPQPFEADASQQLALRVTQNQFENKPTTITLKGDQNVTWISGGPEPGEDLFGRMIFSTNQQTCVGVCSILPYEARQPKGGRAGDSSSDDEEEHGLMSLHGRGVYHDAAKRSLAHLLQPKYLRNVDHRGDDMLIADTTSNSVYDPEFLDDPEIRTTSHRTVLHLIPGLRLTIVPFVKDKEIHDQLNLQFRQRHPDLAKPDCMTLTKIRSVKRETLDFWARFETLPRSRRSTIDDGDVGVVSMDFSSSNSGGALSTALSVGGSSRGASSGATLEFSADPGMDGISKGLDIAVLAAAVVNFEKLILGHHVTKSNHKLVFACCLLLSFKMHLDEPNGRHFHMIKASDFLSKLCSHFRLDRADVLQREFKTFKQLEFSLFVPGAREVLPHFKRLLAKCSKIWFDEEHQRVSPQVYFGDKWYHEYFEQLTVPVPPWMSVEAWMELQQQQVQVQLAAQDGITIDQISER